MIDFWKNAQKLMDDKGVKQIDLARLTGKNKSSVSDWIKHGVLPKADDAVKIADYLGVTVRYLVTGERAENELSPLEQRLLEVCKGLSDPQMHKVIKEAVDIRIMVSQEKGVDFPGGSNSAEG